MKYFAPLRNVVILDGREKIHKKPKLQRAREKNGRKDDPRPKSAK